jgi:hypothetical protein
MKTLVVLVFALSSGAAFGSTVLLTSDPGIGTTTTFTDSGQGSSLETVTLDGFSVTGNPFVVYGNEGYAIPFNGSWGIQPYSYIATNTPAGSIIFNLGGDYSLVGAFLNYATEPGAGPDPTITALASDGTTVIGTYDIATLDPINTPNGVNAGAFVGIESSTADIAYLELSNGYILAHSIEVGDASAVAPEPSSPLLLGTGLLGVVFVIKKAARLRSNSDTTTI